MNYGAPTLARVATATGVLMHVSLASSFIGTILLAITAEAIYIRTRDKDWGDLAHTFAVISTIIFGVGAAFGTLVEFGLVTIWSNFVAQMGSAISLPFFIELFAFLFEVVILPLYIFTWGKIKNEWLHWIIGFFAAFGGVWSAYNILDVMASLSMRPPGMEIIQLQKPISGVISYIAEFQSPSQIWNMFWWGAQVFIFHGILAAIILSWSGATSVVLYKYLREHKQYQLKILKLTAPVITALTAIQGFVLGHYQGMLVLEDDPLKLAAMEGLFWSGYKNDPLLSLLAYLNTTGKFWGYYSWPAAIRPPSFIFVTYWGFMVIGGVLLGAWALGLTLTITYPLFKGAFGNFILKSGQYAIGILAALASIGGALTTESGRYPFIFVQADPNPNGPPNITGIPVSAIYNPTFTPTPAVVAGIIVVELAMPALAWYMVYLYLTRKVKTSGGGEH
ncbi:MAG: cytochrome ubiquinol oxidase subunit I [Sulfolobaceae archaeon]|nr:cytochrome ubiquinol oxidase subunit I [Sulfolobaceae archaeon]